MFLNLLKENVDTLLLLSAANFILLRQCFACLRSIIVKLRLASKPPFSSRKLRLASSFLNIGKLIEFQYLHNK